MELFTLLSPLIVGIALIVIVNSRSAVKRMALRERLMRSKYELLREFYRNE